MNPPALRRRPRHANSFSGHRSNRVHVEQHYLFAGLFHGHGDLEHGTSHALGFFGSDAGHLHPAILDLAQFGEDQPLLFDILFFADRALFQQGLQFEQALLDGRVVGVLFLGGAREGAHDELEARDRREQKIVDEEHAGTSGLGVRRGLIRARIRQAAEKLKADPSSA